ncbi:phospholipid/cholesterol/gamma-HCH transport system substrate-binding protein [Natronospira proteinivora]|uniref:Phospholipid/cholesterol/gamma-HCH transport system substrate-binding protein n=1 Tax=Natronospira proteinivora TaxID=1807133 RepID=A0ABT1GBR0_9GAMM|nr:MlaD family protein [Natronospira proteinivora]MCP1727803.1 phospholipid/cholesterol/gamma-HCH transport system substrate-binding protein [Natronospira proteinivora]
METRSNHTLIGLFVVIFTVAAVALGLWIAGELRQGETRHYTVYLEESVSGLGENSRVLFQGVPVGRVSELALDPDNPSRVRLTLEIEADVPIRTDTRAVLRTQGAMGSMRLELESGEADAAPLETPEGEPYPVIQSRPSFWARVDGSVDEGLAAVDTAARQLTRLLSDDNIDALAETLHHLETFSGTLARNSEEMDRVLAGAADMAEAGELLADRLPETLDRLDAALLGVERFSDSVERAADDVSRLAGEGEQTLDIVNRHTLREMDALLRQLQQLSDRMSRLSEQLSDEPNQLLFGPPRREPGPGEQ